MIKLDPETIHDIEQLKQIAKRNIVAVILCFLSLVALIGSIDGGLSAIWRLLGFVKPVEPIYIKPKVNLLGGSGWLKASKYSCSAYDSKGFCRSYTGYPSVYLVFDDGSYSYPGNSGFQVGNSILLKENTKIFVNNYRFKGISDINTPPYLDGDTLSDNDLTNMILNKGDELLIQKVAVRKTSEEEMEIWLKVSQIK